MRLIVATAVITSGCGAANHEQKGSCQGPGPDAWRDYIEDELPIEDGCVGAGGIPSMERGFGEAYATRSYSSCGDTWDAGAWIAYDLTDLNAQLRIVGDEPEAELGSRNSILFDSSDPRRVALSWERDGDDGVSLRDWGSGAEVAVSEESGHQIGRGAVPQANGLVLTTSSYVVGTAVPDGELLVFDGLTANGTLGADDAFAVHAGNADTAIGDDVTNVLDIDGDGLDDLVVEWGWSSWLSGSDLVSDQGIENAVRLDVYPAGARSFSALGDFDGDGYGDFAAGKNGGDRWSVAIIVGPELSTLATVIDSALTMESRYYLGRSVGLLGEHDADGSALVLSEEPMVTEDNAIYWVLPGPFCGTVDLEQSGVRLEFDEDTQLSPWFASADGVLLVEGWLDADGALPSPVLRWE